MVGGILLLQALGVFVYLRVDRVRRAPDAPFAAERLRGAQPAPELELERADGRLVSAEALRGRFVLVHFWATWCPPCRKELPGLLRTGRDLDGQGRLVLLAVSVDDDWQVISDFFAGKVPPEVLRARDREGYKRYGVSTLPDTYLVSPAGELLIRFGGARDWISPGARQYLMKATAGSP